LLVTDLAEAVPVCKRKQKRKGGRVKNRRKKKQLKSVVGKVEFFITAAMQYGKRRTFEAVYVMHTTGIHIVTAHKHYIA
jgi:hypothetical protein